MAYSELIKSFTRIRSYMRQFLVYGFRRRIDFDEKSARSYDNERRRIDSWLGEYMSFRQDAGGRSVFLSVDSRQVPRNPIYRAWKASGFTKNDITLHFLLLDLLADGTSLRFSEISERLNDEYLTAFCNPTAIDASTLRKKLKEYSNLGLLSVEREGNQLRYRLSEDGFDLEAWSDAIAFFSEEDPIGVVGSYLQDKLDSASDYFSFKHRYFLFALDSGIMLELLLTIGEQRSVELELENNRGGKARCCVAVPLKIGISVQGGRQYLMAYGYDERRILLFRLDNIRSVNPLGVEEFYETYQEQLRRESPHIWGAGFGGKSLEHIEMTLKIAPGETHILQRLEREKRCGTVETVSDSIRRFSADVYDARELLPWIRTFTGRITGVSCSNKDVEQRFYRDMQALSEQYGCGIDAVQ